MDLKQTIGKSHFTNEWLLNTLDEGCEEFKALGGKSKVQSISSKIISEGQGYLSSVYRCDVDFGEKSIPVCLKVPTSDKIMKLMETGENAEENAKKFLKVHDRECLFYEEFGKIEGLRLPKIYSTQKLVNGQLLNAHILMEFMGEEGSTLPLDASITEEQMIDVTRQVSLIHSYSVLHPELWKGQTDKYDFPFNEEDGESWAKAYQTMLGGLEANGGKDLRDEVDVMQKRTEGTNLYKFACVAAHLEAGVPDVICHGDLWGNNILFAKNGDKGVHGLIDFQLCSIGNPTQDIMRLLVINASAEVRRALLPRKIFEVYHEEFTRNLKLHGREVNFTVEGLAEAAKSQFMAHLFTMLFLAAFHFGDGAHAEEKEAYMARVLDSVKDATLILDERCEQWIEAMHRLGLLIKTSD